VTRANGITHAVVAMSASGSSLMPGQASIIHLDGWTWEEMRIEPGQAVQVNWPTIRLRPVNRSGPPRGGSPVPSTFKEAKKQYDARVAELDKWIEAARHYAKAEPAETDHRLAALVPVIESQKPLLIVANGARAIRDAIAFTEKHNVKLILAGVAEAWKVIDLLKEKKVPVILQLVERLPGHQDDPYDHPFALAAELHSGGVPFAFATFGADKSRLLPYQAAVASAYGLPKDEALRAVTLYPARILSIDDRFGTIEEGKVANLIVTTGDPLEIQTETKHLFIRGQLTPTTNKHQRLYEKYRSRPRGQ
ncbi:MAG: amidohydrolase family protein, partial [bacterium]|nr:amidohydrolase family protein [bacterium]